MRRVLQALPLALLALAACSGGRSGGGGGAGGAAASKAPAGPRQVITARAEATEHRRSLSLGGTLEPAERVEIAARVEGAVTAIEVDLGSQVERGATLARIGSEDFAARTAEIDAQLAQARADLARTEQMVERELGTRESLEQARTKVRVAEAQRRLAGRQLRDTRVIAPFDGAIASRLVSPGAFVRVGTPMFVLVASSPMRLAIDVPERHAGSVREGTAVTVVAEGGTAIDASVARLAPVVDPARRTFRAEVEVPAAPGVLPGMFVQARIDLGAVDDAMRVPRAAVFEVLGRARVVRVVDGRAQPADVEMVGEEGADAIVLGLAAGEEVVARSPGLLAPGAEVVAGDAPPHLSTAEEGASEASAAEGPRGSGGT